MSASEKTTKIQWQTSLRGGGLADPVEVEMAEADVEAMRARWREVVDLPTGAAKTQRLIELRTMMDVFAWFPGTRFVDDPAEVQ